MPQIPSSNLVSIVIPNWNGKEYLDPCLTSIYQQTYKNFEAIVIDNGSKDDSVDFLKTHYNTVKIIELPVNTGFSHAVNLGIKASMGEYIALINNDTVLDADWVKIMVETIEKHPETGSVACKMLMYNDPSYLDGAGDGYRRGGLPGRIGHRERDLGQFNKTRYVMGACGGAALYRKSALDKVGLFDEDYFAYLEDVDLGLRLQSAGYKCLYTPQAIIYHVGCGTTGSGYSPMVVALSSQNNINTIVKNLPFILIVKFLPQIFYFQLYYFLAVTIIGKQPIAWFKGSFKALLMLPKMLKKRYENFKIRKITVSQLEKIIIDSENELKESKMRLNNQHLRQNSLKMKVPHNN